MCRHIYDWNIVNCDVKQLIQQLINLYPQECTILMYIPNFFLWRPPATGGDDPLPDHPFCSASRLSEAFGPRAMKVLAQNILDCQEEGKSDGPNLVGELSFWRGMVLKSRKIKGLDVFSKWGVEWDWLFNATCNDISVIYVTIHIWICICRFLKRISLSEQKLLRDLVCALGETSRTGDSPAAPTWTPPLSWRSPFPPEVRSSLVWFLEQMSFYICQLHMI